MSDDCRAGLRDPTMVCLTHGRELDRSGRCPNVVSPVPAGDDGAPEDENGDDLAYQPMPPKRTVTLSVIIAPELHRQLVALVSDAMAGAAHGWTELQALDFQRRCRLSLQALGQPR